MQVKVQQGDGMYLQGVVLHIQPYYMLKQLPYMAWVAATMKRSAHKGTYHLHTKRQPIQFILTFGEAFLPPWHV